MRKIVYTMILSICAFAVSANEMYRASSSGDSGTYFIVSSEKGSDGLINVLSSRIGKGNAYTDFTKLKVNCASHAIF